MRNFLMNGQIIGRVSNDDIKGLKATPKKVEAVSLDHIYSIIQAQHGGIFMDPTANFMMVIYRGNGCGASG